MRSNSSHIEWWLHSGRLEPPFGAFGASIRGVWSLHSLPKRGGYQIEQVNLLLPLFRCGVEFQQRTDPRRVAVLVAVTVVTVVHHLAVVDASLQVYLPEDDAPPPGGPQAVAAGGMEHLLPAEQSAADHDVAERAVHRQALLPESCRGMAVERCAEHRLPGFSKRVVFYAIHTFGEHGFLVNTNLCWTTDFTSYTDCSVGGDSCP